MADLSKTIQIVFESVDNASTGVRSFGQGIESMADGIGNVTGPLADLSDSILKITAGLAATGGAMIAWSVNEAGKFTTATREINTLVGLTPELMRQFENEILVYGRTSTSTFEDINRAVYQAISTGTDYSESLVRVAAAERLADAGRANLVDSTLLLSQTMNAYGATTAEVDRYADAFFRTVQVGTTTIPELAGAFSRVTGSAAALNIPIETLGAAFAAVTSQGADTAEASTRIAAVLSSIINPSKQAAEAAQALGIDFSATAVQTRGLEAVLGDVRRATGGNVETMAQLFGGTRAVQGALALTAESSAGLNEKLKEFDGISGGTARAAGDMGKAFESLNQTVVNAFREIGVRAGREFLDTYEGIGIELRSIFTSLSDGIDAGAFDPVIDLVNKFGGDIRGVLADIAKNLPEALGLIDWGRFERAMQNLAESISKVFDGVDVSSAEGLARALQSVINLGGSFFQTSSGIVESLRPLIQTVANLADKWGSSNEEFQLFVGELLGFAKAVDLVLPAIKGLGSGIESLGNGLSLLAGSWLVSTIAGLAGPAGLAAAAGAATTAVGLLGPAIAALAVPLAAFEFGKWVSDWTGLGDAIERALEKLRSPAEDIGPVPEQIERFEATLARLAQQLGLTSLSMDEFNVLANNGAVVFDKTTGTWVRASDAAKNLGESFEAIGTSDLVAEFNQLNPALTLNADGTVNAAAAAGELVEVNGQMIRVLRDSKGNWVEVGAVTDDAAAATRQAGQEMQAAAQKAELMTRASADFILGWERIRSAERVAIFEARANIDIARIEADARRTIAAFDSLSASFVNTGETLNTLFGLWAGLDRFSERSRVQEWIEREYKIREDLAKSQTSLIDAEIKRMQAQTELLKRGGVDVRISSDGLEPALEAFMFQVIDKVRTQVAGSYEDFLLGCGT